MVLVVVSLSLLSFQYFESQIQRDGLRYFLCLPEICGTCHESHVPRCCLFIISALTVVAAADLDMAPGQSESNRHQIVCV